MRRVRRFGWESKIEPWMVGMTFGEATAKLRKAAPAAARWEPDAVHKRILEALAGGPRAMLELEQELGIPAIQLGVRLRWLRTYGRIEPAEVVLFDAGKHLVVPGVNDKGSSSPHIRYRLKQAAAPQRVVEEAVPGLRLESSAA